MSDDAFTLNDKNLSGIMKALKDNMRRVRVGVLGGKTVRSNQSASTNAAIGAIHEFGTEKMPQRSFLRVPISENLQKRLEASKAFGKDELNEVAKQGTLLPWLAKLAIIGTQIVADAFDTGGFGKWQKWKKGYESNTGQILVDTQQLRNSISSDIK